MKDAVRWLFELRLPDTDEPEIRKKVAWIILLLNFLVLICLIIATDYVVAARRKLDDGLRFERHLCHTQQRGRRRVNRTADGLTRYLLTHGATRETVRLIVVRQPRIDCKTTGREIP